MEKYYITTPIYYPSSKLHIGHSYTTVAADTMARYKRLKGFDVMFLTGTDEHGQKIQRKAEEAGITPKEYVDNIVSSIVDLWKLMKISNDDFIRTTDKRHEEQVKVIFKKLYDQGDIYKSEYKGWYCTPCESYWTPTQIVNGCCPDCGAKVEKTKEEAYFFRLSKYNQKLIDYIETHPDFIQPVTRRNEMLNNFLKPGLDDLCVSRTSFTWGIPVEFDPGHVIYVWVDALSNYITALGRFTEDTSKFEKYWPADVHLVGKEIVRFHTIIWPAILMALGETLPKQVFGHGWMLIDGGKMSKSKGNVVDPVVLINKYGLDAIRYFLLREVPFGADGQFTNEALIMRINSDLANDLGNLVSRTVAMTEKYFDGTLPTEQEGTDGDNEYLQTVYDLKSKVESNLESFQFSVALAEIWKVIGRSNKYIDENMPWALAKDESKRARLARVLYNLTETIRRVAVLIQPFLVDTPEKIFEQIGIKCNASVTSWESVNDKPMYPDGAKVCRGEALFPRIDLEAELKSIEENAAKAKEKPAKEPTKEPAKEAPEEKETSEISIDEFERVTLKVGTVKECEAIPKSDKLLKLMVDLGTETRQIVSGIAKYYTPDEMIGKQVVVVTNLKPVKLRGVDSFGMILCASDDEDNKLYLVSPEKAIVPGAEVR